MEYRWGELFDGQAHLYRAGRDFDMSPGEFARLVETRAEELGYGAAVKVDGHFVAFRAAPVAGFNVSGNAALTERIEEAVELRRQGWTYRAIGERFGLDERQVRSRILRHLGQARA